MPNQSNSSRAALLMVIAAVLFGTTGTTQAFAPDGATPLSIGAVRQATGGVLLAGIGVAGWVLNHGWRLPRWSRKAGWVLLGGACVMAFQATFFVGTRANGVAVGTVVALGSSPLFAGLFEWMRGELPTRRWAVATGVAVVGLVLLSGFVGGSGTLVPLGLLASLAAGAAYAGYAVAASILLRSGLSALPATSALIGTSGLIALAILPFTDNAWVASAGGLAVTAWLGLVTVVVTYLLVGTALKHLTASTAITLGLAEPITAAALGVLVLGEALAPVQWLGLAAVLAGVLIAGTEPRAAAPPPLG
ncbi:MAG TPA: EamA family transporter [Propionicimonas sp.]|nr:EamA family transporter [Propionicimonas sp.]HRA07485.1 EamA family transporter [Propionicimonas sp.]